MGWLKWGTSLLQPSSWFGSNEAPKNPQFIHLVTLDVNFFKKLIFL